MNTWKQKPKYTTGKPCKKCGSTKKLIIKRVRTDEYAKGQVYYSTRCIECKSKYKNKPEVMADWQKKNAQRLRDYQREYYKDKYGERNAKHEKRLKERYVYDDMDDIQEFYRNCPKGFHVDHIIPLNGKNVSGLHTIGNLQYLPASENQRKYNKFNIE
jgi:nuclear transport factor 2 (NTF2) superfamily protein